MRVVLERGLQRVIRVIGASLPSAVPGVTIIQDDATYEPKASELPLIVVSRPQGGTGILAKPNRSVEADEVAADRSMPAVASGAHTGDDVAAVLVDDGADFANVQEGFIVYNVTQSRTGHVTEVVSATQVRTDITFDTDDEYGIWWPTDALEFYVLDRNVGVVLNLFAKPNDSYATGWPIELLEEAVLSWAWGAGREALNVEAVEMDDATRLNSQDDIIATGLGADYYRRTVYELTLRFGDGFTMRRGIATQVATTSEVNTE
jgi:hypothetical protein